jgi:hypothetical protein
MNTQSPKAPRRGDTLGADRHSLSVAALGAVMPLIGMSVSPFVVPAGSSRVLRREWFLPSEPDIGTGCT